MSVLTQYTIRYELRYRFLQLARLEERQEPLRKELERHGIECAMLPMRHAITLGGCFHCVTNDLIREDD